MAINLLPDSVFLNISYFDGGSWHLSRRRQRLVHVCERWRSVGFASPTFLELGLVCGRTAYSSNVRSAKPSDSLIRQISNIGPVPPLNEFRPEQPAGHRGSTSRLRLSHGVLLERSRRGKCASPTSFATISFPKEPFLPQ